MLFRGPLKNPLLRIAGLGGPGGFGGMEVIAWVAGMRGPEGCRFSVCELRGPHMARELERDNGGLGGLGGGWRLQGGLTDGEGDRQTKKICVLNRWRGFGGFGKGLGPMGNLSKKRAEGQGHHHAGFGGFLFWVSRAACVAVLFSPVPSRCLKGFSFLRGCSVTVNASMDPFGAAVRKPAF